MAIPRLDDRRTPAPGKANLRLVAGGADPYDGEPPFPFRCEIEPDRTALIVHPIGELDLATVPEAEAAVQQAVDAGWGHIVVDLRRTCFVDSTAIRMLLRFNRMAAEGAWRFEVVPGEPQVQRTLELCGVTQMLAFARPRRP